MTVVVTGGSGLVGSHVIAALVARGERVRALARPPARDAVERLGADVVIGDVADPASWRAALDTPGGVRGVVHSAALVQRPVGWDRHVAVNVDGARLAAEAAREVGARLVHVSSVAVYGGSASFEPHGGPRTEDTPFRDIDERDYYARSKRRAEEEVHRAARDGRLAAALIRPNVIYGERDRQFTPGVLRALRWRVLPQVGPGTNRLSCVYVGNVAAAIVAALDAPLTRVRAFNVTADAPPALTQRELLDAFAAELGIRPIRIPVPPALATAALGLVATLALGRRGIAGSAVRFATGDNPYSSERARQELNWNPPFTTREAVRRTVAWYKSTTPGR